jgi:hypothetical protein
LSGRSGAWGRSDGSLREGRRVIPGMEGPNFVATKKCALFYGATKFGPRGVFHIRNTRAFRRGVGCFTYGTPQGFWRGGCFTYGTPGPFGGGTGFCLRNAPALGVRRPRLRHSPHPPMALSAGRAQAFPGSLRAFRRVRLPGRCRVFPGLSRRISCRQKMAPIFRRQKIRGGWIPSGCGEPLRKPFSSLKAPYGCRGGRPSSPGPIGPCAAFPWLPTAITLLPPCAPGAFPRGLPGPIPGFARGSFPRRRTRQAHGTCSDETSALPGVRPRRSKRPVRPGLRKAFSQGLSREAHGKGMGGWG